MLPGLPRIRCRQIAAADIDGVVDLLTTGFPKRTRAFWVRALRRLSEHPTPPQLPKYGYLLEREATPVGVLLLISSAIDENGEKKFRCNVSSWYVEPASRTYAAMLVAHALKHKYVTYFNITPDASTLPILEAQGYVRYCSGRFVAVPALSKGSRGCNVRLVASETDVDQHLPASEIELLLSHANYGCISLMCVAGNFAYPFVFLPLRKQGVMPYAYLAYCRSLEDFIRLAGSIGRFLAGRGISLVVVDSNGPVSGLVGWYSGDAPKYFKGPARPRLGDLAYSERVMFGY
jgi:hypothetical protein